MQIMEIRDMATILKIVPQECEIRQKGIDRKPLKNMLMELKYRTENDPNYHVLFAYDSKERLTAYCFIELKIDPPERRLTIYRIWADIEHPLGLVRLWQLLKEMVKVYSLKSVNVLAPSPEAVKLAKEWGFRPVGMLMENLKLGRH